MNLSADKSYVLGLILGGGTLSRNSFDISLPYKEWGEDPGRMRVIARDILTKICDCFTRAYGFPVTYEIGNKTWYVKPISGQAIDLTTLKRDLRSIGLADAGKVITRASLETAKRVLGRSTRAKSFLSGFLDARASVTPTHRRFVDTSPVVSLEIPGSAYSFEFIIQLCSWMTELGSVTDQILFNHPCFHTRADSFDPRWTKGFKIRLLVKSFLTRHSFVAKAKAQAVSKLKEKQATKEAVACSERTVPTGKLVAVHDEIESIKLPEAVRGKLFFHYHHVCALLGCEFAPTEGVKSMVRKNAAKLVLAYPFPRLRKDDEEVLVRFFDEKILPFSGTGSKRTKKVTCRELLEDDNYKLYPDLEQSLAYLFAPSLRGRRPVGPTEEIIKASLDQDVKVQELQEQLSPLLLINDSNKRAAVVSSPRWSVNERLIRERLEVNGLEVKYRK